MKTKNLLIVFVLSISFIASGQKKQTNQEKKIEGNLVHTVLFWLKNPDSKEDRKAFEKGVSTLLKECKFITSSHFGTPANTEKRDVVDASFTYCAVITFASKEAHDSYQIDPLHKKFIEDCKNLWSKVLVYDSEKL